MKRKRNIAAYEAWMARKREGRLTQIWVPDPNSRQGDWQHITSSGRRLLAEIFGGAA